MIDYNFMGAAEQSDWEHRAMGIRGEGRRRR